MWKEGKGRDHEGDNECYSKANKQRKKGFEECQVAPEARPQKGHLALEVKIGNEIICDYLWDKLYALISVTCSKWYIRKARFVFGAQPLDLSPLHCCKLA
jgi:hypothetical protein